MFYRFLVKEEHRNFLRFFWYRNNDPNLDLIEYRMRAHVFGNSPSPAVATFALHKAVEKADGDIRNFVMNDFYVDDALTSGPDASEVTALLKRTQSVLQNNGNIRLHKVVSNSMEIVKAFPQEDLSEGLASIDIKADKMPTQSSLGVSWNLDSDTFHFDVQLPVQSETRREMLSTLNSIFDPMGILSPFSIQGRILLRELTTGASWDTPLPISYQNKWNAWKASLTSLKDMQIPRMFTPISTSIAEDVQLHVYCDASELAVAAVAYMQTRSGGDSHIGFVMGRAKLAPSKGHTIPRLELCAAVLAVEVGEVACETLGVENVRYHSDSRVVLGYINNRTRRFYTYVANRVERILRSSRPSQWIYVSTCDNPADQATRSSATLKGFEKSLWLQGPKQLPKNHDSTYDLVEPDNDKELRPTVTSLKTVCQKTPCTRFEHFSSWRRLANAVLLIKRAVQRFRNRWRGNTEDDQSFLPNRGDAEVAVIRLVQQSTFSEEIGCLEKDKPVPERSPIKTLDPYLDNKGILRVGGRLRNSCLPFEETNPIILPKKHHVSKLIVRFYHEFVHHQGRLITEGSLRNNGYWIIGAKRLISSIIRDCVTCRKLRGKFEHQKKAALPADRLVPGPPFTSVGVDVFGPWSIVTRKTRGGSANSKRWAVLFTCLTTRAIHIEVVEEMTSSSFINALRRFVAFRGNVKEFRSDCGTNFIGAVNELGITGIHVGDAPVAKYMSDSDIVWKFNAPHSSHMGGVWERMIGLVRRILEGMMLDGSVKRLTHEVLTTFMAEVCAIVNSRPIASISTDPKCPEILSPATLLNQKIGYADHVSTLTFSEKDMYKSHWRQVQALSDIFWRKWREGYIQNLQSRKKWKSDRPEVKEGDIILLREKTVPRSDWRMGIVTRVFRSDLDNKVRKAEVRIGKDGVSICGMGGLGKTALANKVCRELQGTWKIIKVDLREVKCTREMYRKLFMELTSGSLPRGDEGEILQMILCFLRDHVHSKTIVLLDNIEDVLEREGIRKLQKEFLDKLFEFFNEFGDECKIRLLLTTRILLTCHPLIPNAVDRFWKMVRRQERHYALIREIEMLPFGIQEAMEFFAICMGEKQFDTRQMERIVKICGFSPLAIEILCSSMLQNSLSPETIIAQLEPNFWLKHILKPNVLSCLKKSFEPLNKGIQNNLIRLSVFRTASFGIDAAAAVLEMSSGHFDTNATRQKLLILKSCSFIQIDIEDRQHTARFSLHPVVYHFLKNEAKKSGDFRKELQIATKYFAEHFKKVICEVAEEMEENCVAGYRKLGYDKAHVLNLYEIIATHDLQSIFSKTRDSLETVVESRRVYEIADLLLYDDTKWSVIRNFLLTTTKSKDNQLHYLFWRACEIAVLVDLDRNEEAKRKIDEVDVVMIKMREKHEPDKETMAAVSGTFHFQKGRYFRREYRCEEALCCLQLAEEEILRVKKVKESHLILLSKIYNVMGGSEYRKKNANYCKAREHHTRALEIIRARTHTHENSEYLNVEASEYIQNIGTCFLREGDTHRKAGKEKEEIESKYNKAIEHFTTAVHLDQQKKLDNMAIHAQILQNRGEAFGSIEKWKNAEEDLKEAMILRSNILAHPNRQITIGKFKMAELLYKKGVFLYHTGEKDTALDSMLCGRLLCEDIAKMVVTGGLPVYDAHYPEVKDLTFKLLYTLHDNKTRRHVRNQYKKFERGKYDKRNSSRKSIEQSHFTRNPKYGTKWRNPAKQDDSDSSSIDENSDSNDDELIEMTQEEADIDFTGVKPTVDIEQVRNWYEGGGATHYLKAVFARGREEDEESEEDLNERISSLGIGDVHDDEHLQRATDDESMGNRDTRTHDPTALPPMEVDEYTVSNTHSENTKRLPHTQKSRKRPQSERAAPHQNQEDEEELAVQGKRPYQRDTN